METIAISDTHLTKDFDERKYNFLKKLFEGCDQLIVNGDFWSFYSCTFDEFVASKWEKLFPLMHSKNTLYIYGNHDKREYMDKRVNLFSTKQKIRDTYSQGYFKYHLEHGHLFFKHQSISNPQYIKLNRLLKIDSLVRHPIDHFLYKTFGVKTMSGFLKKMNNQIKQEQKNTIPTSQILVTGHTHVPEIDKNNKFVNTGFIDHGLAWYLKITNTNYKLIKTTY